MEIKTTEDIMYDYVEEEDHCLKLCDIEPNVQWVRVEEIKKILNDWDCHNEDIRKTINTIKFRLG